MGTRIIGIGGYVPSTVLNNDELARRVDTSDDWIVSHTGIRERRLAEPNETLSDMGCAAARRCLSDAGVEASAVDLIVVASATPDQSQPAVACMIQEKLGMAERQCPAFDVNSVCAGFVFALNVAQSMMIASPSQYRYALVIGADAFSKILNWEDRRTCIFFGDGAGAVLLAQTGVDARRMHFALGSDGRGRGRHYIEVPAGDTRRPADADVLDKRLNKFFMQGHKVWKFAMETVPRVIRGLLAEHGLAPDAVDLLILHLEQLAHDRSDHEIAGAAAGSHRQHA